MVHEDTSARKSLYRKYIDIVLIPSTVIVAGANRDRQQRAREAAHNDDNGATDTWTGICDPDGDEDEEMYNAELTRAVDVEVRMYHKAKDLPNFGDDKISPLKWWATHATSYPLLFELAMIVLATPSSQIECERVFSVAGLFTSQLRNRMSPESLGSIYYCIPIQEP